MQGVSSIEGTLFLPCELGSEGYYMKRRLALVLLSAIMVLVLTIGLAACGDKPAENPEFEEYEKIVTTVIENTFEDVELGAKTTSLTAKVNTAMRARPMAFTADDKTDLFAYLDSVDEKEVSDNTSFYKTVFEQTFYLPLVGGNAIRTYHGATDFYNVGIGIESWQQYFTTLSEGTQKITYLLSQSEGDHAYYYMEIDYKSEQNFEFRALRSAESDDEKLFLYGNSGGEFLAVSYISDEETAGNSYVQYDCDGQGYTIIDPVVVGDCYTAVEQDFADLDITFIDGIYDDIRYTLSQDEWEQSLLVYFPDSGMTSIADSLRIENGVLYGWQGDDAKCPSVVEIPSDVTAIVSQPYFPAHVKKLVIPASVRAIKDENGITNCSVEDFMLELRNENGGMEFLQSIELVGNSPIFSIREGCLYAKASGTLLYIPQNSAMTKLTLDSPVSQAAEFCLRSGPFSVLKELTVTQDGLLAANWILSESYSEQAQAKNISLDKLTVNLANSVPDMALMTAFSTREMVVTGTTGTETLTLNLGGDAQHVLLDIVGSVWLDNRGYDAEGQELLGEIEEVELTEKVARFEENILYPATISLPYSVFYLTTSGKGNDLMPTDLRGSLQYETTELISRITFGEQDISRSYRFRSMTDEERAEYKILCDFKNISFITEEYSEYGEPYASITGYWGEESVIEVPESILGYPVYWFELCNTSPQTDLPEPTVDGVAELHLPATLKVFSVWNVSEYGTTYALEKIVYDGTKEQFKNICSTDWELEDVLASTKTVECTDGVFEGSGGQTEPTMRYYLKCTDGTKYDGASASVTIDWGKYSENGGISVSFIDKNGNEYPVSSDGSFGGIYYFELHIEFEAPTQSIALRFDVDIRAFEEENIAVGTTVLWAYDPNGGSSRYEFVLGNVETLQ